MVSLPPATDSNTRTAEVEVKASTCYGMLGLFGNDGPQRAQAILVEHGRGDPADDTSANMHFKPFESTATSEDTLSKREREIPGLRPNESPVIVLHNVRDPIGVYK